MNRNGTLPHTPSYRRLRRKIGHDLAFVDIDGHRNYLGPYDTPQSRERYHRLIAELEASGGVVPTRPDETTVAEVASQFMKWARTYYVKHGRQTAEPVNLALAIRPLLKLYGRSRAAEFGPRAIKAVRQEMIAGGRSRRYVNRLVGMIKRMFKWAVAEELTPPSVFHGLLAVSGLKRGRCGARETQAVQPVAQNVIESTKAKAPKPVVAMIELQLLTGARPGEIVIMRPCDIDRSGPVWTYRPSEHKTEHHGHDRIIFIGPKAQEILVPFLLRPAESYCFSPKEAENERRAALEAARVTPLSCGNRRGSNRKDDPGKQPGDHYTTQSYGRAIRDACRKAFPPEGALARQENESHRKHHRRLTRQQKAEVEAWYCKHHWHPHQLRHNYATMVRKEYGLEAAQVLLGHSNADVTQIYAERDMGRAAEVARKIG